MEMSLKRMEPLHAQSVHLKTLHVLAGVIWEIKAMRCTCGGQMEIAIHANRPPTFVCLSNACDKERPVGGENVIRSNS